MSSTFSVLSLKRHRTKSVSSKKESRFNLILNKLVKSIQCNNPQQKRKKPNHRKSSVSTLFDYFRFPSNQPSFENDALFEHDRYNKQKQNRLNTSLDNLTCPNPSETANLQFRRSSPIAIRRPKPDPLITQPSNIALHSEDLTAKEFATLAGIRILPDEEELESLQRKIGHLDNIPSLIVTSSKLSCCSSTVLRSMDSMVIDDDDANEPQIWDDDFWQKPAKETPSKCMPSLVDELKRQDQDTFIKKGRFEIHLTSNHQNEPAQTFVSKRNSNLVVEWKRKCQTKKEN